jgi:hypothetical protein
MSPLNTVGEWTIVHGKRELNRFERENFISYRANVSAFPCLVRSRLASDENAETEVVYAHELEAMLAALNPHNNTGDCK